MILERVCRRKAEPAGRGAWALNRGLGPGGRALITGWPVQAGRGHRERDEEKSPSLPVPQVVQLFLHLVRKVRLDSQPCVLAQSKHEAVLENGVEQEDSRASEVQLDRIGQYFVDVCPGCMP